MAFGRRRRSYDYDTGYGGYAPYVPVAARRAQAEAELRQLARKGGAPSPVTIVGRDIATTFWGQAWCENLERYSDYANRIPRGSAYVRNGAVVDLKIEPGVVRAYVSGTTLYTVEVKIKAAERARWSQLAGACAGKIDSVVELLQGKLSTGVMQLLIDPHRGLFPGPREIEFSCSCPDWASMCKHVAATLYGVGARLDHEPALLFRLRKVSQADLVATASAAGSLGKVADAVRDRVLDADELGDLFGIELDEGAPSAPAPAPAPSTPPRSRPSAPARAARAARAAGALAPGRRITPAELLALGVPRSTFQNWPNLGILARTDTRGVYEATDRTPAAVARFAPASEPAPAKARAKAPRGRQAAPRPRAKRCPARRARVSAGARVPR